MNFTNICEALVQAFNLSKEKNEGRLADYIPELAKVNPNLFSATVTTVNGDSFSVGDQTQLFSLQSTSKPIVYSLALK